MTEIEKVYVVTGDPNGHVHLYGDRAAAVGLAVGWVSANLDGAVFAHSIENWDARVRSNVEAVLASGNEREGTSAKIVDHRSE